MCKNWCNQKIIKKLLLFTHPLEKIGTIGEHTRYNGGRMWQLYRICRNNYANQCEITEIPNGERFKSNKCNTKSKLE